MQNGGQVLNIKAWEIKRILENRGVCREKAQEFVRGFGTLMESLATLYEQDLKAFAVCGISVNASVSMTGDKLCEFHLGASGKPEMETENGQDTEI